MIIVRASRRPLPEDGLEDMEEDTVRVQPSAVFLTDGSTQLVRISWRIKDSSSTNAMDWIGLYRKDDRGSSCFLDYKVIGSGGMGSLQWTITTAVVQKAGDMGDLQFRYFDGITGVLRAVSSSLRISNVPKIRITNLTCHGLPRCHSSLSTVISSSLARRQTEESPTGGWTALELDFSTSGVEEIAFRVFETSEKRETLVQGRVPIADFIGAARQDLSVSVRTPLLRRRIHEAQPVSLLVHFELLPDIKEESPPSSSAPTRTSSSTSMQSSMLSTVSSSSSSNSSSGISSGSNQSNLSLVKERLGPLPDGWESRIDWHGRIFYIDHDNKKTTWKRPEMASTSGKREGEGIGTPSKMYHPSRRTVTQSGGRNDGGEPIAVRFLQRDDLMALLHSNETALRIYNSSRVVKHIVHRIRRDHNFSLAVFEQNEDFVRFVNAFADSTQRLPDQWQATGEYPVVFIDHSARQTTLLDPRLPIPTSTTNHRRTRSAPPRHHDELRDQNGNSLLIGRTEEIVAAVARKRPELLSRIRRKMKIIERWGEIGVARLANDVDVATAISLLENEEDKEKGKSVAGTPEQDEFDEKVGHFYASLQRSGYGAGPSKLKLRFSRSSLLHDAYDQILAADVTQLRKARLSIAFDDEDGLDYGGPSRELFFLLSRELFNPYYGLFEYAAPNNYTVQISPMSAFVDNQSSWMELAGRVLGLALVHRCLIDTFFTRTFYKMLLELPFVLEDLESVDGEFCRSLRWMRENHVDESLGFTFSVTQEIAGEVTEKELLPNGKDLPVTDRNKEEFIQLMVRWRVERGVQQQTRALLRGLHQIIERDFLRVFSVEQVELVLSGSVEIDLDDWQTWTEYKGGYSSLHVVVRWFWDTVEEMNNADRLKLLQFVTGTASVPYEGFRALRGSNGSKKFTIERWGDEHSLPRAHTCFNRLDLPSYPSKKTLREKLLMAIHEGIAYAIE